ncbi:hypothetical protein AMS68_001490 [Peltaster fructicola]|uniref:Kinetochore protein mis14 n=1 Tax=Peltaster fructicola TaxID=286661 RepID=A0A6H0XMM5_9PEZI|nr:hypothetical protein AMS68_001490 [Peltaster fructicola]
MYRSKAIVYYYISLCVNDTLGRTQQLDSYNSFSSTRAHRKVELQSPDDLTYLIAKLSRTARDKIDKHFPPEAALEGGEDKMRAQVEILVDEYIRRTYTLAKPNLSINGMDPRELEAELAKVHEGEEFEPFDAKLAYRIQELSREIEDHTLQLAELRREAPATTASKYQAALQAEDETYQTRLELTQTTRLSRASETKLNVSGVARVDEIKQTWQESNEKLADLKSGVEQTIKKAEQAGRAQQYVSGS